jgi:hypothetical protein
MTNKQILESFVDSSSEPYLRSVRESLAWGWGLICKENPYSSGFVGAKHFTGQWRLVDDPYPLYSRGNKLLRN